MDKDITYVLAVARHRSISKAAGMLYISQPSLSHYITSLESRLGVSLFERTPEGAVPTEAGREYIEYAEQIQSLYTEMHAHMQKLGGAETRQIDVCFPLSMNLNVAEIQQRFGERYPDYNLNIVCAKSRVAYEKVKTKSCAFAVGPEPRDEPQLHFDKYLDSTVFLAVPTIYDFSQIASDIPEIDYPAIDLRKLPELRIVLQAESTNTRHTVNRLTQKYDLKLVPVMEVESTLLAIMSARRQLGCCFLGQSYRGFIEKDDPIRLYVLDMGDGNIEKGTRGIISLAGKQFTEQERYVYRLSVESMVKNK